MNIRFQEVTGVAHTFGTALQQVFLSESTCFIKSKIILNITNIYCSTNNTGWIRLY